MEAIINFFKNIINDIKYSEILQNLQIPEIRIFEIIEILIIIITIYRLLLSLKNTRAWIVFKGVVVLMTVYFIAYAFSFSVIMTIFRSLISILAIGIIILFQGELRKILENIGKKEFIMSTSSILKFFKPKEVIEKKYISDKTITCLVEACKAMSKTKTGALIVIKKDIPLNEYISTGIDVDAKISAQMLMQIFEHNTPLHDGALIIENDRLASATCYLPLTESPTVSKELGTRHRAGIGISEVSDCLVIIVSEETGNISIAENGKLSRKLTDKELESKLKLFQSPKIIKIDKKEEINNKKNAFKKNKRYKFIATAVGIVLWLLLANSTDPVVTETINNIPVEIVNENILLDSQHTYNINSGKTASIVIKGRKSIVSHITIDDFKASADFKNLSIVNSIPIDISTSKNIDILQNNNMMNITIEEVSSIECPITVNTVGELKESNYIESIDVVPGIITITGPTSVLNTIGDVIVEGNVSSVYDKYSEELTPIIYDKNGIEIDMNNIKLSSQKIKVIYNVYKTKKVDINLTINNTKFNNGEIISYFIEPSEIRIAAPNNVLESINKLNINIDINVNDDAKTSNMIKSIDINDYIKEQNIYVKEEDSLISVNFYYEKYIEKIYTIKKDNIKITNKNEKFDYLIEDKEYEITIKGLKDNIENLNMNILQPYVDVKDISKGINNVKLNITKNDNIVSTSDTNIKVIVNEIEEINNERK
jgi:diadenylate cyclase